MVEILQELFGEGYAGVSCYDVADVYFLLLSEDTLYILVIMFVF